MALIIGTRRTEMTRDGDETSHLDGPDECDRGICARPSLASPGSGTAGELNLELTLKRDDFSSNRHPALGLCWSVIFSENRCTLFGIML